MAIPISHALFTIIFQPFSVMKLSSKQLFVLKKNCEFFWIDFPLIRCRNSIIVYICSTVQSNSCILNLDNSISANFVIENVQFFNNFCSSPLRLFYNWLSDHKITRLTNSIHSVQSCYLCYKISKRSLPSPKK